MNECYQLFKFDEPKTAQKFQQKAKGSKGIGKMKSWSLQSWKHCNELAQKNEALRLAAVLSGPWACILWSRKISMNSLDIIQNGRKKQLSRKVHSYCFDFYPSKLVLSFLRPAFWNLPKSKIDNHNLHTGGIQNLDSQIWLIPHI